MKINELEKLANYTNLSYRKGKQALIEKVPVPILYTAKGLVASYSTVDYVGLLPGGKFIAFDAKETEIKTSFPLANIKQHQLLYLQMVREMGGIVFLMIHFKKVHKDVFITPISVVEKYFNDSEARKSIPIGDFKETWLTPVSDYINKVNGMINEL